MLVAYFLGISVGSLFYGSLSDRFGRRRILLSSTALFLGATLCCALAQSFVLLLLARLAAGIFAAGTRIVALSVVRDRFGGDAMASVISLVFIVIIVVPMVAPSFGQLVLYIANWRWIFGALLVISGAIGLWAMLRLPERWRPKIAWRSRVSELTAVVRRIITHRLAIHGYMVATGVMNICFVAFLSSVQQIFADVFHRGAIFPYVFAAIAGGMAVGSCFNNKLVHRFGARRMSHSSSAGADRLLVALHAGLNLAGYESLVLFVLFSGGDDAVARLRQSPISARSRWSRFCPRRRARRILPYLPDQYDLVAGRRRRRRAVQRHLPLNLGFLACTLISLALVFWAERGRLFNPPAPSGPGGRCARGGRGRGDVISEL